MFISMILPILERESISGEGETCLYQYGIKVFWLDGCEPEMILTDPENLRFHAGDGDAVANIYPLHHVPARYKGMKSENEQDILFLCRGSKRWKATLYSATV